MANAASARKYRSTPRSQFYNARGTAEQWIREGKNAILWTRLSCRVFKHNAVRLQLHALAYNLANFMRALALPEQVEHWSLTLLEAWSDLVLQRLTAAGSLSLSEEVAVA